jgi:hypothetical protein
MKKIFLAILLLIAFSTQVFATAGSCTESVNSRIEGVVVVKFVCTGDSSNGTLPTQTFSSTAMAAIQWTNYLYTVSAYPTSGGTAPDAADITVLQNGEDLLGGKGVNLLHATATYTTFPYSTFMSMYRYPLILNTLTWTLANQATNSANFTVELVFVR